MSPLPFVSAGDGAPLVSLHGFTGAGSGCAALAEQLPGRRIVAPDLPGHGGSARYAAVGRAGFSLTLQALHDTLDELALPRVDLHGYSMGARLALAFALKHPQRVRRLVLESGSPGLRTRRQRLSRRRADERLAQLLEIDGLERFTRRWEALPLFAGVRALPLDVQERLRSRRMGHTAGGLAWALRSLGTGVQASQWERLGALNVPALVLAGELDAKFARLARAMAERLPNARLRILPGCHHVPHLEAPRSWAAELSSFLS